MQTPTRSASVVVVTAVVVVVVLVLMAVGAYRVGRDSPTRPQGLVESVPTAGEAAQVGTVMAADGAALPTFEVQPFRLEYSYDCGRSEEATERTARRGGFVYHDPDHYYSYRQSGDMWRHRRKEGARIEFGLFLADRLSESALATSELHVDLPWWLRSRVVGGVRSYSETLRLGTGFSYPVVSHAELIERLHAGQYKHVGIDEVMQRECLLIDIGGEFLGAPSVGDSRHQACVDVESGVFLRYMSFRGDGTIGCTDEVDSLEWGTHPLDSSEAPDFSAVVDVQLAAWDVASAARVNPEHGQLLAEISQHLRATGADTVDGLYLVGNNYVVMRRLYLGESPTWNSFGEVTWAGVFNVRFADGSRGLVLVGEAGRSLPFYFGAWPDEDGLIEYVEHYGLQHRGVGSTFSLSSESALKLDLPVDRGDADRATTWQRSDGVRVMVVSNESSLPAATLLAEELGYVSATGDNGQ